MATKPTTITPATPTLPAPVTTRQRSGRRNGHGDYHAWKAAKDQALQVVGYDQKSPIYGKTDVDVLNDIKANLTAAKGLPATLAIPQIDTALDTIDELLKRKTARAMAGQTYRSRP